MAGGLPLAFPTISLCEPFLQPSSMHYRNLMALDTEAMITAQPMDAVVLVGGCDKTVPAQLMAAASADVPAVQLVVGPMSANRYQASDWPPAPTAAAIGRATAPATSARTASRRSRATSRPPPAPAA
jgi:dihydroxyacid dehydratase/phosphogluconate dehydratase